MISAVEDIDAIRFRNGKRINLPLLKNEIDRKFLRIMMLVNKVDFVFSETYDVKKQSLITTDISTQTRINQEPAELLNLKQLKNLDFSAKKYQKEKKLQKREDVNNGKKYNFQQQNFLICKQNNQIKQSFQESAKQRVSFQQVFPQLHIPLLELIETERPSENFQVQLGLKLSPIKFSRTSRTDRTTLNNTLTTTMRSFQRPGNILHNRLIVSEDCMEKMLAQVLTLKQRHRKDASQNNIRINVLKKIQEKFKPLMLNKYQL